MAYERKGEGKHGEPLNQAILKLLEGQKDGLRTADLVTALKVNRLTVYAYLLQLALDERIERKVIGGGVFAQPIPLWRLKTEEVK